MPMTFSGIEEYSLRSIAVLVCNMHSQITVGTVTLPKALLSTVKYLQCILPNFILSYNVSRYLIGLNTALLISKTLPTKENILMLFYGGNLGSKNHFEKI